MGSSLDHAMLKRLADSPPPATLPPEINSEESLRMLIAMICQEATVNLEPWIRRLLAGDSDVQQFFSTLASVFPFIDVCSDTPFEISLIRPDEPAYQCSTCGVDPTCIQCATCFRLADHTGHKIKMTHAGGGGLCDCGDLSSWAEDGVCSRHARSNVNPDAGSMELSEQTSRVLDCIVTFVFDCVAQINDHSMIDDEMVAFLSPSAPYVIHLCNDSVHTFDEVVGHLHEFVGLSRPTGLSIALKVDYFQRCIFANGTEQQLLSLRDVFIGFGIDTVITVRPKFLCTESQIVSVIKILTDLCAASDSIRCAIAQQLSFSRESIPHGSYMSSLMHASHTFSLALTQTMFPFHFQLFILMDFKEKFTLSFTKDYADFTENAMRPSQNGGRSVLDYSVQLYTIPDMVLRLCQTQNLLGSFLETFQAMLIARLTGTNVGGTEPMMRPDSEDEGLVAPALRDLSYIVGNNGVCEYIYRSRPDIFLRWLDVLHHLEGRDMQIRQQGSHVEYESLKWWLMFSSTMRVYTVSKVILGYLETRWVPEDLKRIIVPVIGHFMVGFQFEELSSNKLEIGSGFVCPIFNIFNDPVSFHYPLRRFIIELVSSFCIKTAIPVSSCLSSTDLIPVADYLMRATALAAHIRSETWVLNGSMMMRQAMTYDRVRARDVMFESDLLAFQCCATVMGGEAFLIMLSYRFMVQDVVFPARPRPPLLDAVSLTKYVSIVELFLSVVMGVIVERFRICENRNCGLDRDIVHFLLLEDLTHSDLLSRLNQDTSIDIDKALQRLAKFVVPNSLDQGKFQVKREAVLQHFDPGFSKYDRSQRQDAITRFSLLCSTEPKATVTIPSLPLPAPSFIALFDLFSLKCLFVMLSMVLSNQSFLTSCSLYSILRIISAGVRDAQNFPHCFPVEEFICCLTAPVCSENRSIFQNLCDLVLEDVPSARSHVDYIKLVISELCMISPECATFAGPMFAAAAEAEQQEEIKKNADKRRLRKESARALALSRINEQIRDFSNANSSSLEELSNNDALQTGHTCICKKLAFEKRFNTDEATVCRSNDCQEDIGLLSWIGKCRLSDFLLCSSERCRKRPRSTGFSTPKIMYSRDCGHAMHYACYSRLLASLLQLRATAEHYEGIHVVDISNGEITCPLCKCHANTLLPCQPSTLVLPRSAEQNCDTSLFLASYLPSLCDRYTNFVGTTEDTEDIADVVVQFSSRVKKLYSGGELDGGVISLIADYLHVTDVRHRDKSLLSQSELMHLRCLLGNAAEYDLFKFVRLRLTLDYSYLKFSVDETYIDNFFSTVSDFTPWVSTRVRFLVHFAVMLICLEEPAEALRRLIVMGFYYLRDKSESATEAEYNVVQYRHAIDVGNADDLRSMADLFSASFLRQAAILFSALQSNQCLDLSYSSLLTYFRINLKRSGTRELLQPFDVAHVQLPLAYVYPKLAPLPKSFLELFDAAARALCSLCKRAPKRACICLICGDIICSAKDCRGGRSGALSTHTRHFCGDQGAFLMISIGSVIVICDGYSCDFASPYLDEHGETDRGLHRGHPLHLDALRLRHLEQTVCGLEIGSYVSRKRWYSISPARNAL